jgi:glucose-6-phosphate isomerase
MQVNRQLLFNYVTISQISKEKFEKHASGHCLGDQIKKIALQVENQYESPYASLYCSFDEKLLKTVKSLVKNKQKLKPTVLIVVGIGGSSLGTKAIQEAVLGRYYNTSSPVIKIYFAQTVDADKTATIIQVMKAEFKKGNVVLLTVVTKSGTTTETIANFEVLLSLLKQEYPKTYHQYVVAITDKDSALWKQAQQELFSLLEIPKNVGGRYSVFSAVGLFPLAMIGIDIDQLHIGAQEALKTCLQEDIFNNSAALSALFLHINYQNKYSISDLFLFSMDLEGMGKWYRQLMGESIGKEKDLHGNKVMAGITPTVSLGSIDLHSVAQLYLAGPHDKMTTFVTVKKTNTEIILPKKALLLPHLSGKSFSSIMNAIVDGTKTAYFKNKRPFCSFELPEKNEFYVGQFMQIKMVEMMYLGYLMELNPFDQPNVELYKKETHKILSQ